MPKMKTHKGAAKRFRKTATGRTKHKQAGKNHILTKKSAKVIRQKKGLDILAKSDEKAVNRLLCLQ